MNLKKKKFLKIAIDSPAAAGAGTLAKAISKHYNLYYLDTGKIYRLIAHIKLTNPRKFGIKFLKKKIKNLKQKNLMTLEMRPLLFLKIKILESSFIHFREI